MMRRDLARRQPGGEFWRAFDHGFALRVAQHGDVAQRDRRTQSGSGRLGEGLLGGEAFGYKSGRVAAGTVACELAGGEDAVCIRIAVTGEAMADALGVKEIGADAVNHGDTFTGKPAARILPAKASSHAADSADSRQACGCIEGR